MGLDFKELSPSVKTSEAPLHQQKTVTSEAGNSFHHCLNFRGSAAPVLQAQTFLLIQSKNCPVTNIKGK